MFNKKAQKERVGNIEKSVTLHHLKEVEKYFLNAVSKYKVETAYDVIANELPYYKTLNYTEWAHCFIIHPISQFMRMKQMDDAYNGNAEVKLDYVTYFKDRVTKGNSNKYTHIVKDTINEPRENLVVLVGSNKLKERICLNKLKWIASKYETDVWFKPHPLTNYQLVGELKDILGNNLVLDRDADMYEFLLKADTVFTSHMSESAVYAVCLDKKIEPVDVYNKVEQGSFYHINKYLFTEDSPKDWLNRTLNSYKSGIINPLIDKDWKERINQYLEYTEEERNKFKNKYI